VDDPIFHRLLDEASDRQAASERRALAIVAEAESLVELGLTCEALHLVTAESAGLQRLSHFKIAKSRIESLASRESQFREQFGRAYAALGDPKLLKEVTSALAAEHRSIGCPWIAAAQGRLRVRVEAIARERVIAALQSAQADLAVDDGEGAHSSISAAQPWTEFVGLKLKDEFRQMSEEVARARKVLRFRHAFRR
jgi:hypothetical protein